MGSHLVISKDLDYLQEANWPGEITVEPVDPENFLQRAAQASRSITREGGAAGRNAVYGAEVPTDEFIRTVSAISSPETEVEETPPQSVERSTTEEPQDPLVQEVPQPESTEEEYISTEDEEKFITYLRDVYKYAYNDHQEELAKTNTDRLYVQNLTSLLHLVNTLEDQYEQPGVVSMNQHVANTRKLERTVENTLESRPKEQEVAASPTPAEQPTSPQAPTGHDWVSTPEPTADDGGARPREKGQFVSSRDPQELDRMADLIYRVTYNLASDEDRQEFDTLKSERPADLKAGRNYWTKLNKRITKLRNKQRENPESLRPDEQELLRELQDRFPQAVIEAFFRGDRVLRHLFEAESPVTYTVKGEDSEILNVYLNPTQTDYFKLYARNPGGWLQSGLVRRAEEQSQPAVEPEPEVEQGPESEPEDDLSQYAQDLERQLDELTPEESELESRIEGILDEFRGGYYNAKELESKIENVWLELARSFGLKRKKPQLQTDLKAALEAVRAKARPDVADQPEAGAEFEEKVLNKATQYRTGWKWWKWGIRKWMDAIKLTGGYSVTKSRDAKQGTEYAILTPAYNKVIYVWVPHAGYQESVMSLNLSPDLRDLMEQDYDVSNDPKAEAPPDAFGIPPLPPGMEEPTGGGGDGGEATIEEPGEPDELEEPKAGKPNRIVVTQNNVWWELSWDNWVQFLVLGASGNRWNLDHWGARYPDGRPNDIREFLTLDQGPTKYYSTQPDTNVYRVKGWEPERFRKELDYVQAMDVAGLSLVEPKPPEDAPSLR